jgi:hypothetical protein
VTSFAQAIAPGAAPACGCGLKTATVFGLTLPNLGEWAIALKHGTSSVMLLARRSCATSSLRGDYAFDDAAPRTIAQVCLPGQVVPAGTYKPASGSIGTALSCAANPNTNSGE